MAKTARAMARTLPSTPQITDPDETPRLAHRATSPDPQDVSQAPEDQTNEPAYLVEGTGCTLGHEPGTELIEPKLGQVPSRKITRIGVGLILWAMVGMVFLAPIAWVALAVQVGVLWLAFSGIVQRRAGHKGHCWRTRSWRYAWGGLVPTPRGSDPTREAE